MSHLFSPSSSMSSSSPVLPPLTCMAGRLLTCAQPTSSMYSSPPVLPALICMAGWLLTCASHPTTTAWEELRVQPVYGGESWGSETRSLSGDHAAALDRSPYSSPLASLWKVQNSLHIWHWLLDSEVKGHLRRRCHSCCPWWWNVLSMRLSAEPQACITFMVSCPGTLWISDISVSIICP